MSPETALQAAILEALSNDAQIKTLLGDPPRFFTEAPQHAIFPYLTLGEVQTQSNAALDHPSLEHAINLQCWSRYGGREEAQTVIAAVRDALDDAALNIDGRRATLVLVTLTDVFRAGDGRTAQGLLRLKVHSEPT